MNKRLLAAVLASLAFPSVAATPTTALPDADPAVWVVRDPDTTIYLFGTIHALDGKRDWFNDEVRRTFDASNELVLEIVPPEDLKDIQPLVGKYMFDRSGRTLTSKLSPDGRSRLAAALARAGLPPTALDKYKPFFASLTLATLAFQKLGFTAEAGAEATLKKAAASSGKRVSAVETFDFQLGLFDRLPEAEQIRLLEQSLAEDGRTGTEVAGLVAAWAHGDARKVAKLLNRSKLDSPALHQLLLIDRNRNWADWIHRRLAQPGTVFMAVGAGHLAGKDSVQRILKKRGIRAKRVRPA